MLLPSHIKAKQNKPNKKMSLLKTLSQKVKATITLSTFDKHSESKHGKPEIYGMFLQTEKLFLLK
jgi:hypothetical protein